MKGMGSGWENLKIQLALKGLTKKVYWVDGHFQKTLEKPERKFLQKAK